jgi:polyhydroxyalkanoate synthesis repressor PhaR
MQRAAMAEQNESSAAPVVIKKYANRRLYNTATSTYVTLDHLAEMIKAGTDFVVTDARSGEDITRAVLTQIIVEQEGKGQNLLPIKFLRQIIGFYGDSLGGLLPRYLESSMEAFSQNESKMRNAMQEAFRGIFPMEQLEHMGRQNMALFENAMKMLHPFGQIPPKAPAADEKPKGENIDELKAQLNEMQAQIAKLVKDRG